MLEQKWYTVADVAGLTGLTSRTIRNYIKDGTLHGKKIGVQWRFTENDINDLFQEVDFSQKLSGQKDNLVTEFLEQNHRDIPMECRIIDIPNVEEMSLKTQIDWIRQKLKENETGKRKIAWQFIEETKLLRIVLVGEPEDVNTLADEMKRGLEVNAG